MWRTEPTGPNLLYVSFALLSRLPLAKKKKKYSQGFRLVSIYLYFCELFFLLKVCKNVFVLAEIAENKKGFKMLHKQNKIQKINKLKAKR